MVSCVWIENWLFLDVVNSWGGGDIFNIEGADWGQGTQLRILEDGQEVSLIVSVLYTVKKVNDFPVPSWDVIRLGTGKSLNFFYSVPTVYVALAAFFE